MVLKDAKMVACWVFCRVAETANETDTYLVVLKVAYLEMLLVDSLESVLAVLLVG